MRPFHFTLYDLHPNLYGFMTYLKVSPETKLLEGSIPNWAGFRDRRSVSPALASRLADDGTRGNGRG